MKNQVLSDRNPYRTVGREQLEYIGGNFYKVDGVEMEVTPEVAADLDAFIGLSKEQAAGGFVRLCCSGTMPCQKRNIIYSVFRPRIWQNSFCCRFRLP